MFLNDLNLFIIFAIGNFVCFVMIMHGIYNAQNKSSNNSRFFNILGSHSTILDPVPNNQQKPIRHP